MKNITAVILGKESESIKEELNDFGIEDVVFISSYFDKVKGKDLLLILPDDFTLNKSLKNLEVRKGIITLPLTLLQTEKTKGILNSCLWNLGINDTPGELNFELAQKQIDLTLFGSFIPKDIFNDKENFNKDLEIYQDFYFFNKVTSKELKVKGIPKILSFIKNDLSFSTFSEEVKVKNYLLAKQLN